MGTFTLDTPILLANGYQITLNVASGTCNGTVTTDPTKISIALTSEGYNSSGVLGTIARTITIASATVSGSTLTCNLSEPIYDDDTAVSITLTAAAFTDITPDTSEALGSTAVDIATTPSTLDYPLVIARWASIPNQKHTGAWSERVVAFHRHGIAAVTCTVKGYTEVTIGAITGTAFVYHEVITGAGGAIGRVAPGSKLTGSGRLWMYNTSGTFVNPEVVTGGTGGGTATISAGPTGGKSKTVTQSTRTAVAREGSLGPATQWDCYEFDYDADDYDGAGTDWDQGPAFRVFTAYPLVGDADSIRTSYPSDSTFTNGEQEIYLDPTNANSGAVKTIYVDPRIGVAFDAGSGTFTQHEYATVKTGGALSAVVVIPQATTGATGTIYYHSMGTVAAGADDIGNLCYTATYSGTAGSPAAGNVITNDDSDVDTPTEFGTIIEVGGGSVTYVLHDSTNFASGETLYCRNSEHVRTGGTITLNGVPSAVGTTVSDNDVIAGISSGATATVNGTPAAVGNDTTGTGTSLSPVRTIMKALKLSEVAHNDSTGSPDSNSIVDGATIIVKGPSWTRYGAYAFANAITNRNYWFTITRDSGLTVDDIRIVRSSTDGVRSNFTKFDGVTIYANYDSVQFLEGSTAPTGSYDRPAIWLANCKAVGIGRLHNIKLWSTTQFPRQYITNSSVERMTRAIVATVAIDTDCSRLGSDVYTESKCIINGKVTLLDSTDSLYHSDVWQFLTTGVRENCIGLSIQVLSPDGLFQGMPFSNLSGTATMQNCAFVNIHQSPDNSTAASQFFNGTFTNVMVIHSTLGDKHYFDTATLDRVWFGHCVLKETNFDVNVTTEYPAMFYNNHYITDSGTDVQTLGYLKTTGSTEANLFVEATDETAVGYYVPKAASTLLDRVPSTQLLWTSYDVFGRTLSTDATAEASVGAAQPLATLAVTYDGASVSDGGTVSEGAGSKDLVMTVGGPTGAVAYISDVAFGGTVSGTDLSPYSLAAGGTTASATITTTLTAGAGTVDISWDLSSVFDFDITGTSPAGSGGFRARSRGRGR